MPRNTRTATREHQALRNAYVEAMAEHAADMPALEILAVTAQWLGQLIAVQDASLGQKHVMEVVSRNIEIGNATAIGGIIDASGGKQ